MAEETKTRYALVTGANKGIGFGICEQLLATDGIVVILTARDEKRGLEAVEKLQGRGFSDRVMFHQLDVADQKSVASLADFVRSQIGKLDILVNNAGILGVKPADDTNGDNLKGTGFGELLQDWDKVDWQQQNVISETFELAEECLGINYYGTKRMTEAFAPLLQLSDSPRIVNVSSILGSLQNVTNEWAKEVLGDADNLTEMRIDMVLSKYLQDIKEGSPETKGWPAFLPAYTISKAAMNAYTHIVAKKYPSFYINAVGPGFVSTDINYNTGVLSVEEGAENVVRLALMPDGSRTSGCFFDQKDETPF